MANKERKITFNKDKLKGILKERKISYSKLSEAVNINEKTFGTAMYTGRIMPDYLEKISELLDISTDYFLRDGEFVPNGAPINSLDDFDKFKPFNYVGMSSEIDLKKDIPIQGQCFIPRITSYTTTLSLFNFPYNHILGKKSHCPMKDAIINSFEVTMIQFIQKWIKEYSQYFDEKGNYNGKGKLPHVEYEEIQKWIERDYEKLRQWGKDTKESEDK